MADTNTSVSAISTDNLEIDSYDDVVKLLGADVAASMLADVAGNRFNRDDIKKAILNGGDIHLDYWPDYEEYDYAACVCGELLADTSLEWAEGFIDAEKIETHEGLTVSDLSHAVECVLTDKFNDGLYEASLVDRTEIADTFAREIESRLGDRRLEREPYIDCESLRNDLTERFGFFYDIDFSRLTFKTSLIASQQATASGGMPRHRRDVRVGIPGGPRVRHCRRGRARIGQHGRRTQRAPLLLRRRTEAGLGVLQGTTFEDQAHRLPGNRRDLRRQPGRRPSPARIAGRHQPGRPRWIACRRAPFLPWRRTKAGTGVLQAGQARTRQEPFTDGGRGEGRRGEPGSPGRWPAAPTRGIIDAVGKAPSVSEGAFLHL